MISFNIFFLTPEHRPDEQSINIYSNDDQGMVYQRCKFYDHQLQAGVLLLRRGVIRPLPDSNHSLDKRCHLVGSIVCPTLRNNVGPYLRYIGSTSFCSSSQRHIANGWFCVGSTSLAQQAIRLPTWCQPSSINMHWTKVENSHLWFLRKFDAPSIVYSLFILYAWRCYMIPLSQDGCCTIPLKMP